MSDGSVPDSTGRKTTIRTVTPEDAADVAALRLAWAAERSETTEPAQAYAEAIADWTAAHEDTVPIPARHDRRSGDIQSVYVAPHKRGAGLGHRLIDALVDEGRAHGLDRIVLHSSTAGMDFYRHIGWSNSDLLLELPL